MAGLLQCDDLMHFQRALKQLRAIDDKIIYALNVSTPTASMKARGADPKQRCLDLKTELEQNYKVYALFQENFFHYMDCSIRLEKNTFESVYL